jgi:hypothetical protein
MVMLQSKWKLEVLSCVDVDFVTSSVWLLVLSRECTQIEEEHQKSLSWQYSCVCVDK